VPRVRCMFQAHAAARPRISDHGVQYRDMYPVRGWRRGGACAMIRVRPSLKRGSKRLQFSRRPRVPTSDDAPKGRGPDVIGPTRSRTTCRTDSFACNHFRNSLAACCRRVLHDGVREREVVGRPALRTIGDREVGISLYIGWPSSSLIASGLRWRRCRSRRRSGSR